MNSVRPIVWWAWIASAATTLVVGGCAVDPGPEAAGKEWVEAFAVQDELRLSETTSRSATSEAVGQRVQNSSGTNVRSQVQIDLSSIFNNK